MRILTVICVLLAFCIFTSCDDDPVEPKKKAPPNYSGSFIMADTLISSSCSFPVAPGTIEDVTVRNDTIIFAGFYGTWDASELRGYGTSAPVTILISPPDCYGHYTVTFDITYLDEDNFYGTWLVAYTYDVGCGSNPCSYLYNIGGTRP